MLLFFGWSFGTMLLPVMAQGEEPNDRLMLPPEMVKLIPLYSKLEAPGRSDWLAAHKEPGQTFRQYVRANPVRADKERRTIYIQPLGDFTPAQRKIVDLTADFMGIYFALPVKIRDDIPLRIIPQSARRKVSIFRSEQILTTYVLSEVLRPRLARDAVALIAITNTDLWPGEDWNYVFGQASLNERVGIWSFNRYGDPDNGDEAFRLSLLRTMKTATHETGHMFSMMHCVLYKCNMCGSNHLAESDRRPLELCPQCLAKLCYATGADPVRRLEKLVEFYKINGLKPEQDFGEKSLELLRKK
jgi:archaemetzincin